jgi:hypothetical protein
VADDPDRSSDEDQLRALSLAYADAADWRDGAAMAALFVADGALVVPDVPTDVNPVITVQGQEALQRVPGALRRYRRTFHLVGATSFVMDGDRATGEVQCVAHHLTPTDGAEGADGADGADSGAAGRDAGGSGPDRAGTDTVWFIRYRDQYRRTGRDWRFVRRELHLQWVEEHPVSVLGPPPDDGS